MTTIKVTKIPIISRSGRNYNNSTSINNINTSTVTSTGAGYYLPLSASTTAIVSTPTNFTQIVTGTSIVLTSLLTAPTVCSTSLVRAPQIYASTCFCAPVVRATTCFCAPLIRATSCFVGSGSGLIGTATGFTAGYLYSTGGNITAVYDGSNEIRLYNASNAVVVDRADYVGVAYDACNSQCLLGVCGNQYARLTGATFTGTITAPTVCGSTCLRSSTVYASTCMCSPVICATTTLKGAVVCASTCFAGSGAGLTGTATAFTAGCANATNAVNSIGCTGGGCVTAVYDGYQQIRITNASNAILVNYADCAGSTDALAGIPASCFYQKTGGTITGIVNASTCICSPYVCATNTSRAPYIFASTCMCSPTVCATTTLRGAIVCATTCFTGNGAGLTGTASSLTVGCANNATNTTNATNATNSQCLGGLDSSCFMQKTGGTITGIVTIQNDNTGGDGTWTKTGLQIINNNASAAETAISMQNICTGANYWIFGLNQNSNLDYNYGTTYTDAGNKMRLTTGGALAVNCSVSAPIINGTTCIYSPIVCATTCFRSPIIYGTTCVTSPIVCATTCFRGVGILCNGTSILGTATGTSNSSFLWFKNCLGVGIGYIGKANTTIDDIYIYNCAASNVRIGNITAGSGAMVIGTSSIASNLPFTSNCDTILNAKVCMPNITNNIHDYALYYNDVTGQVTYYTIPAFVGSGSTHYITTTNTATGLGFGTQDVQGANTSVGICAGAHCASAIGNTSVGNCANYSLTNGAYNVALGNGAGTAITSGQANTNVGTGAGQAITTSSCNTTVGYAAGTYITGSENVIIGALAGYCNSASYCGCGNILIGYYAGSCSGNINNKLIIHNSKATATTPLICGDFSTCDVKICGNLCVSSDISYCTTSHSISYTSKYCGLYCPEVYGRKQGKINYITGCVCMCVNGSTTPQLLGTIANYIPPKYGSSCHCVYFPVSNRQIYENARGYVDLSGNIYLLWGQSSSDPYSFNFTWITE